MKYNEKSSKTITSFETVTLRLSGMRMTVEYEIVMRGDSAEVSQYEIRYSSGEDMRILTRRSECGEERMLKLMNDCRLMSWDGFSGKHPRGVLDGTMFRFSATVNGGARITADGSENFPRNFRDFTDGLYEILNEETAAE